MKGSLSPNEKLLFDVLRKIEKLSRYDRDHDNILYNYQDINLLAKNTIKEFKAQNNGKKEIKTST